MSKFWVWVGTWHQIWDANKHKDAFFRCAIMKGGDITGNGTRRINLINYVLSVARRQGIVYLGSNLRFQLQTRGTNLSEKDALLKESLPSHQVVRGYMILKVCYMKTAHLEYQNHQMWSVIYLLEPWACTAKKFCCWKRRFFLFIITFFVSAKK